MKEKPLHNPFFPWLQWTVIGLLVLGGVLAAYLFFTPKPLVVKGALKTKDGPVVAGTYDFRLKFYDATTRTDLVYSYDANSVAVNDQGEFATTLPSGDALKIATLMQVCIASKDSAIPGTVTGGKTTLPSCETSQDTPGTATFNQTICGLTTVDQNPTNTVSWMATKNVVYASPTKACGQSEAVASISGDDVVTPLLNTPGSLGDVLGGVSLQPGTVLTVGAEGEIAALPPAEAIGSVVREEIAKNEPPPGDITNVFNTYPTTVQGESNTDNQTLLLNGSVLSISGGNSVTLPAGGAEQDGVVGNEIVDVGPSSGLVRVGTGTTVDPFKVGLITCASGQLVKSTGAGTWGCANDTDTVYSAGTGISLGGTVINNTGVLSFTLPSGGGLVNTGSSQNVALALQDCANGEILQFNTGSWECVPPGSASPYSFAVSDTTTSQPVLNGDTVTFIGTQGLVATVSASDTVTYGIVNGGVTTLKLADGSVTTDKIADGTVTTIDLDDGSVTNDKLASSSLTVSAGAGLSGGGVVALGASTTLNLQPCGSGQILKHNGTTWACAADSGDVNTDSQTLSILASAPNGANTVAYDLSISGGNTIAFDDRDTLYTAATSGGLALNGAAFSLQTCPVGQLLKSTNAVTPTYICAADTDTNTTYSAGTGLSLTGTTFSNTGVLSVAGAGAITSTGGQNPIVAFANGSTAGQFWQWDGDSWELATLAAEQDAVIGNEVTNVTGASSGLVRSGSGTAIDPYTLAANVGNGLQIASNTIGINSPTCSGTDKLQWTGTTFVCSADVDTDTNTTYTASNGLQLVGTTFSINSPTCAGTTKLQWTGTAFVCSVDVDTDTNTDAQTLSWVDGTRTLSISGGNSVVIPDANTTYSALTNGGLRLVGTQFGLNVCTSGQVLKAQATSGEWDCAADTDTNTTYSAGTGLSLAGTTFNNTGTLTVTASGALTSSGGQNPNIAFADGASSGQFWQWDGDSWELATLAAEQDAVIGNEVTNVTGANSGLVRSGAGTAVDPYTLAVSVGNGLQLSSGAVAVNSPTCSGTDKLQWTGTVFVCSVDVDTDTNTTYTADGLGIELTGTIFSLELNGTTLSKGASGLALNLSNPNTWAGLQTFGVGATVTTGQTFTMNGDAFTDLTGTGLTIVAGALQTTLGTSVDLVTEVTNTLPVGNGGTGLTAIGAANQLLGTNAAGTALEYKDLSSLLVAGSGISLSGTTAVTISNTGAAAACSPTSSYVCNGGNTLGATLNIGTNDAQSLTFETNNAVKMTILSGGNVGIGVSPSEKLDVNGNINIPTTTSSVGIIKQNGVRWIHSYGGITNFFAGANSGNFTLTGTENVGIGQNVFQGNTSGSFSVAAGNNALDSNTTGSNNIGIGWSALTANTTGSNNTATGTNALLANIISNYNSAFGAGALQSTTGVANTAVGNNSLNLNVGGGNNVAIGYSAGVSSASANANTSGSNNTYIGFEAGLGSTTQRDNSTAIGFRSVVNQSDSLVLGCIAGTNGCGTSTKVGITNAAPGFLLHVGSSGVASGTSVARFENAGGTCTVTPNTAGGISCTSDERLKKNVEDFSGAVDVVNKIDVKKFNMLADTKGTPKQIGVIAQQLETVLPGMVQTDKDGYKSVAYAALAPVLLGAVKEQQVEITKLKRGLLAGGIVTKDTTFKEATIFEGPTHFIGGATFAGDVTITGKVKLSGDQSNQVVLPAGSRRIAVTFKGAYRQPPHITATPRQFITGSFRVTNVRATGFVIEVKQPQSEDIHFDWHAFAGQQSSSAFKP